MTLDEIGAAAGIAGPSVYSHFAGKTELLRTITERIGERLRHDLAESDAAAKVRADGVRESPASSASVSEPVPTTPSLTTPSLTATAAIAALADLATRYVTTVLSSRDLVAAYFTEGHNLPDRDRAETRRFQRAYTAHWAALLAVANPAASPEEIRIRVLAAFAVVNDTARTRRLLERPGLAGRLRALMLAVLLTPASGARDVNRR